jgi:hypothetical protein
MSSSAITSRLGAPSRRAHLTAADYRTTISTLKVLTAGSCSTVPRAPGPLSPEHRVDDETTRGVSISRATRVSWSEEGGWDDGDAVWPTVGVLAGGDDDRVEEFGTDPIA